MSGGDGGESSKVCSNVSISSSSRSSCNGSNSYITVESTSEACFNLRSNNFTIDWFQHGIFDSDNETSIVFVVGNYSLGVTFQQRINNILRFNLYVNNSIKYILTILYLI